MSITTEKEITVSDGLGNATPSNVMKDMTFSSEEGFNLKGTFDPESGNFINKVTATKIGSTADSLKAPIIAFKGNGYTTQDGTPTPSNPIPIQCWGELQENGKYVLPIKVSNEDNTESITANIPIDAPLYEGDYIEFNADGTGIEYRMMKAVKLRDLTAWKYKQSAQGYWGFVGTAADKYGSTTIYYCDSYKYTLATPAYFVDKSIYAHQNYWGKGNVIIQDTSYTDLATFLAEMGDVQFVYELAAPTITPLTDEQIAEFKKLMSFDGQTTFSVSPYDAEFDVTYYKNTESGKTVGGLKKNIDELSEDVQSHTEDTTKHITDAERTKWDDATKYLVNKDAVRIGTLTEKMENVTDVDLPVYRKVIKSYVAANETKIICEPFNVYYILKMSATFYGYNNKTEDATPYLSYTSSNGLSLKNPNTDGQRLCMVIVEYATPIT